MTDIDELIKEIMDSELMRNQRNMKNKVYSDQPLLKRGSQIKSPGIPQKIRDMKAIAYSPEAYWNTSAWLFYTQGNFMSDYTDVYEYSSDFSNIFPTYAGLTTEQLRGYFSWRTRIREGEYLPAPSPFVFMYVYELLNNIGLESPEAGFYKLIDIFEYYGKNNISLHNSLFRWISDHAVYYNLDRTELDKCPEFVQDKHLIKLIHYNETDDDELFDAMDSIWAYSTLCPDFYERNKENFRIVAARSFRSLSEYFRTHRKNSLFEKYFGKISERPCRLFDSAIFYQSKCQEDTELIVNEIRSYRCKNGVWSCKSFKNSLENRCNIRNFLFTVEKIMREKSDPVSDRFVMKISKNTEDIIRKEFTAFNEEQRIKKASEVRIDLSQLSSIRADADITRDKLLTEDDIYIEPETKNDPETAEEPEIADIPENTLLNTTEIRFLQSLINNEDWTAAARDAGQMPSILSDSINEKLFDIFGDTVIDFSSDIPEIIEDYSDDIKSLIKNGEL